EHSTTLCGVKLLTEGSRVQIPAPAPFSLFYASFTVTPGVIVLEMLVVIRFSYSGLLLIMD
ncbi:hypothetical protein, partial [Thermofilum sp.]|uniref:hypothetical protein n=1 Tax=Thermofilum sp. TaxID=1961369 RepID=UPI002583A6E9